MERWGVGDTHFTGSHIGGIHISLGICVRGYTYHGDTHITGGDNGGDGRTDGRTDGHVAPKLLQSRPQGLFVFQYGELQPNLTV